MNWKTESLCLTFLMFSIHTCLSNNTYYLDQIHGNDNYTGKSEKTAWKSLQKINNSTFYPGDQILLKRGQSYDGCLLLSGSGTNGSPARLGAYGTGMRPLIRAGDNVYAIRLLDSHDWVISDIETNGGMNAGIFIGCTKDNLQMDRIIISNCYVHDIGDTTKPDWIYSTTTGGIIVVNGSIDSAGKPVFHNSVFNNVTIYDCIVRYNLRWTCISITSGKLNGIGGNENYIRNCIAEFSSADGIRMNGVRNSRIEFCTMFRNGSWPNPAGNNLGGLGAWFFNAENCTIQYCEASHTGAKETDGGAFDIDYWQKNSMVQYCYGHDCAGYGVSVFGADESFPTENSIIRFNVFANNGRDSSFAFQGDFFVYTWHGGLLNGLNIYDNISFWKPSKASPALKFDAKFTGKNPNFFCRNTIYSEHPWFVSRKSDSLRCDSNLFTCYIPNTGFKETDIPVLHFIGGKTMPAYSNHYIWKGSPVLIFYAGKYDPDQIFESNDFLRQLIFIRSMKRQYGPQGLKVIVISDPDAKKSIAITNFLEDHEINGILFNRRELTKDLRKFIKPVDIPTTFLISEDGSQIREWENLVLPAQLGLAIELANPGYPCPPQQSSGQGRRGTAGPE